MAEDELIARLRATGQGAFSRDLKKASADVRGVGGATKDVNGRLREANGRFVSTGESAQKAGTRGSRAMRLLKGDVKRAGDEAGAMGVKLRHLVAIGAGYKIASGFRSAIAAGFDFNAMQDSQRVGFTTLFRSQTKAADMMRQIQLLALKSPVLDPKSTGDAARLLMAYGLAAKDTLPMVEALGDMSAATGRDISEVMPRGAMAIGQIGSKGKLQAEELNQLAESVGLSRKRIAKQLGMTQDEFAKTFQPGKGIKANRAIPAILAAMREQSAGAAEMLSKTPHGQIQAAKERGSIIAGSITRPLYDRIGQAAGDISKELQGIWTTKTGKPTKGTLEEKLGLSRAAIGKVTGPLADEFGTFWRKHHVGDRISDAFESTMTTLANKAGEMAPKVAMAFARAWWDAGVWGKLIGFGFLASKLGLLGKGGAFRRLGSAAADSFGASFKGRVAASGATWKSSGRIIGRYIGPAIAVMVAAAVARELQKQFGDAVMDILSGPTDAAAAADADPSVRKGREMMNDPSTRGQITAWKKSHPRLARRLDREGIGDMVPELVRKGYPGLIPGSPGVPKDYKPRAKTAAHAARAGSRGRLAGGAPVMHVEVVSNLVGREVGRGVAKIAAGDLARG